MPPIKASSEPRGPVGLVLAGGGARGAYEIGALSVLLPALKAQGDLPDVVVGTSVGAINAVYTAGHLADDDFGMPAGRQLWEDAEWKKVLRPIHSWWQFRQLLKAGNNFFGGHSRQLSLLDPKPLEPFLQEQLCPALERIPDNLDNGTLTAAAVVATAASSYLSVVFHHGGGPVDYDDRRGIRYVPGPLGDNHVRASAAIPGAFPAVDIDGPDGNKAWYFDGGTRLNTPIKPARDLGAKRLIVVALNAPRLADPDAALAEERADLYDGLSQITQALLVDPLINDLHTIVSVNKLLAECETDSDEYEPLAYMLIAPRQQDTIGKIACEVYNEHYARKSRLTRDSVARMGKLLGAGENVRRADLFSNIFFDGHFARALMRQGEQDAHWWLEQKFGDGSHWHTGPLP